MEHIVAAAPIVIAGLSLAILLALARWLRAMNRLVVRELTNGEDVDHADYIGFRKEVDDRLERGSLWMESHEQAPASEAHGVLRERSR